MADRKTRPAFGATDDGEGWVASPVVAPGSTQSLEHETHDHEVARMDALDPSSDPLTAPRNQSTPTSVECAKDGAALIAAERQRQISVEDWTPQHDDTHDDSEMTAAACCYAALARRQADGVITSKAENIGAPSGWPWDYMWWKPSDDPIRNLVKAGALIAAEIDRIQRTRDGK